MSLFVKETTYKDRWGDEVTGQKLCAGRIAAAAVLAVVVLVPCSEVHQRGRHRPGRGCDPLRETWWAPKARAST